MPTQAQIRPFHLGGRWDERRDAADGGVEARYQGRPCLIAAVGVQGVAKGGEVGA